MGSARLPLLALALGVFTAALPGSAGAQDPDPPAHLAYADGTVTLEREGDAEEASAGLVLLPGDRLNTSAGRAEILFPDGSALAIDEFTVLDLQDVSLLRLTAGRVRLTVAGATDPAGAVRYQIDTPASSVTTEGPGEYRIAVGAFPSGTETELFVLRGYAAIATDRDSMRVRSGEHSTARAGFAPSFPRLFNSARSDAFDRWADARRGERMGYSGASRSAQYLPADLRVYGGTLDRYGAWGYEPVYGDVWYPTVAPSWRPYYHGSWSSLRGYGWTWTGLDVWSWPTHHYGRWGHTGSRWFWRPDRRWGPAWVSWAAAPGYVGWCPLGFDNRPVFAISVGRSWNGWVAMPRARFGSRGAFVHREAVPHRAFQSTPFITQAHAPVAPYAVPRSASPRNGINATRDRPIPGRLIEPNRPPVGPGREFRSQPRERRPVAVPRSPEQAAGEASPPGSRERASSGVIRQSPPASTPLFPSNPSSRARRGVVPPTMRPAEPAGNSREYSRRAGPGVVEGPRPGVVTRTLPPDSAREPAAPTYNPGAGVIRGGSGRVDAPPGGSSGSAGSDDRSRAVRRSPPASAAPQTSAGAPGRDARPRQPASTAPAHGGTPPAASGSAAPARRGPGGNGSGDSGRARRR